MKFGCIGERLAHSFSKEIHNRIGEYDYILHEVQKDELDSFLKNRDLSISRGEILSCLSGSVYLSPGKTWRTVLAEKSIILSAEEILSSASSIIRLAYLPIISQTIFRSIGNPISS